MDYTVIVDYLVTLIPSIVAVCTSLGAMIAVVKQFVSLRKDVKEKVEMAELKEKFEIALSDSKQLQELLRKELETKTHIKEE